VVGIAGHMEGAFEGEEVFLPSDVATFEWLVAVWAQIYFWAKVYLFCPAVVFGCFH
jgi:hypothetical protein